MYFTHEHPKFAFLLRGLWNVDMPDINIEGVFALTPNLLLKVDFLFDTCRGEQWLAEPVRDWLHVGHKEMMLPDMLAGTKGRIHFLKFSVLTGGGKRGRWSGREIQGIITRNHEDNLLSCSTSRTWFSWDSRGGASGLKISFVSTDTVWLWWSLGKLAGSAVPETKAWLPGCIGSSTHRAGIEQAQCS